MKTKEKKKKNLAVTHQARRAELNWAEVGQVVESEAYGFH